MTAATPRTANRTPDLRRVGVAVGAMTLAVALVVTVAVVRQAGSSSATTPVKSDNLIVTGTNGGGINYTGIPYPAPRQRHRRQGHQRWRHQLHRHPVSGGAARPQGAARPPRQRVRGDLAAT